MDACREQRIARSCATGTKSGGRVDGQNFKLVEFKIELFVKLLNLRKSICD